MSARRVQPTQDAERAALERALQAHGQACAEVAEHADALAAAEGAE